VEKQTTEHILEVITLTKCRQTKNRALEGGRALTSLQEEQRRWRWSQNVKNTSFNTEQTVVIMAEYQHVSKYSTEL
jgi:hypothetical protein